MKILRKFLDGIKSNTFWKSVTVLVSGTILAQLLIILATPIVSRLYDPKAFGEYAIIVSTSTIIINIVSLGLTSSVMIPKNDDESKDVFMVATITTIVLSTCVLALMIIVSPFAFFFDIGMNYIIGTILVFSIVVINSIKGLLTIYVNRKSLNRILFYNSLIGAFSTLLITIPLGLMNLGSLGLIMGSMIGGIVSITQMVYHVNPFKSIQVLPTIKRVMVKYKDFIFYQYPSNLIGELAIQLPTQVLSSTYGNTNLGSFSMNEKVLGIPLRIIGAPINTVYFRTASDYHKNGKNLADFTFSLVIKIMLISFFPIMLTVLWGGEIFTWVLGTKWREAGEMAGILVVQYVFLFCTTCTSYCKVAIGKQRANLVVSILRLLIVGLSVYSGIYLYGDLLHAVIFFTIGSSIYHIIDMAINFYLLGKYWTRYVLFSVAYISIFICVRFFI